MIRWALLLQVALEVPGRDLPKAGSGPNFGRDILLIVGVGLGLLLLLVLWASYFRRPDRPQTGSQRSHRIMEESDDSDHHSHRHRRKKRKREHRSRNPSLAETGGLPPRRPEDESPPGA
jgi:hypothetical protein